MAEQLTRAQELLLQHLKKMEIHEGEPSLVIDMQLSGEFIRAAKTDMDTFYRVMEDYGNKKARFLPAYKLVNELWLDEINRHPRPKDLEIVRIHLQGEIERIATELVGLKIEVFKKFKVPVPNSLRKEFEFLKKQKEALRRRRLNLVISYSRQKKAKTKEKEAKDHLANLNVLCALKLFSAFF